MDEEQITAIEQPKPDRFPTVIVTFDNVHSTGAQVSFSAAGVDLGQLIIAKELIGREIERFVRQQDAIQMTKPPIGRRGLFVPGEPRRT